MLGVILVLVGMFVVGPVALFMGGAIWSALFGWLVAETVDPTPAPDATS